MDPCGDGAWTGPRAAPFGTTPSAPPPPPPSESDAEDDDGPCRHTGPLVTTAAGRACGNCDVLIYGAPR